MQQQSATTVIELYRCGNRSTMHSALIKEIGDVHLREQTSTLGERVTGMHQGVPSKRQRFYCQRFCWAKVQTGELRWYPMSTPVPRRQHTMHVDVRVSCAAKWQDTYMLWVGTQKTYRTLHDNITQWSTEYIYTSYIRPYFMVRRI